MDKQEESMTSDVIIIGSGLGGLECGCILASNGLRVTILEREAHAGGCMQSFRRRSLDFDTGLHYIGGIAEGQSLYYPFRMLGLLDLPWQELDSDGFDHIIIGGQTYLMGEGYDNFTEILSDRFPSEKNALKQYCQMLKESSQRQWDALNPLNHSATSSMDESLSTNAWDYLHRMFQDETLINVLSGNAIRMELRRESLPLFTFAHCNSSFIESSWRLRGCGNMLVNCLADGIRKSGGEIRCNTEVKRLVESDGKIAAAVCSDGNTYEAPLFISDVHPAVTIGLISDSHVLRPIFRKRISNAANTFGMLTVQLVLRPDTIEYFNHNHYVYNSANVWDFYHNAGPVSGVMISCRVPEDGSRYARQIDLLTPMPWEECCQWAGTFIGHRGEEYEDFKQRKARECIALAERAVPGLPESIAQMYISTPLTYRDYTLTPNGSAYGMRKDCNAPMFTTLSPRTPLPNLLLTGQSLMLHGVQGVTMTAMLTCSEILGKDTVWKQLNV